MQVQDIRNRLVERARALGLEGESEERLIDELLDREVQPPAPTEADCRRYYDAHRSLFRSGDVVEADHILFAVTEHTPLAALRSRARQVHEQVLAEPVRFAALAGECSNCPSARVGGNLGQLTRREVVPEFWQAIAQFPGTGILPTLVETRYGLHVLRVTRRIEGRELSFEAVQPQIAARLAERGLQQALRDYAHALAHGADEDHPH
jgi:peptidyl-prolyl cis-trans isomerase C